MNALVARGTTLSGGAEGRPGHRAPARSGHLGPMLVAKTDLAHRRLGAPARGPEDPAGVCGARRGATSTNQPDAIDAPIARHPTDRQADGGAARWSRRAHRRLVLARFAGGRPAPARLHSGRTHQIRVHLAHVGHPVVGDPVYGAGGSRRISGQARLTAEAVERAAPRQALHAATACLPASRHRRPPGIPFGMAGGPRARRSSSRRGPRCLLLPPRLFAIFFSLIEMADSQAVRVVVFQVGDLACGIPAEPSPRDPVAPSHDTNPRRPCHGPWPGQRPGQPPDRGGRASAPAAGTRSGS